jgi:hypothetical protein
MAKTIDLREATKTKWVHTPNNPNEEYPGDENIKLGCLMRIADASEKMASNYTQLQNDRDCYKRWYNEEREAKEKLNRTIKALRGVITKLKRAGKV